MSIEVRILMNEQGRPAGKLADAEKLFNGGELAGLKLVGFEVGAAERYLYAPPIRGIRTARARGFL